MSAHALRTYAVMLKPIGAACNLRCTYCYYLEKGKLLSGQLPRMPFSVLDSAIRQIIAMHGTNAEIELAWHGGEPALLGLDFLKKPWP